MDIQRSFVTVLPKCCSTIRLSLISLTIIAILISSSSSPSAAQVISPELRRLALATNQFGIDTLKALDRIEPPDRVLVFCPVCLSSSLMMIMMGSSKYPVVSSLRHALYVWSMKPQEINKGFRDIFDHIGFNQNSGQSSRLPSSQQQQHATTGSLEVTSAETRTSKRYANFTETATFTSGSQPKMMINDEMRLHPMAPSFATNHERNERKSLYSPDHHNQGSRSLPSLIKLKELMEQSMATDLDRPWWHTISGRSDVKSQGALNDELITGGSNKLGHKEHRLQASDLNDTSQMSALSNIYIQRGLAMNFNYNLLLRQYYKTVIHPVDFLRNAEETRQHINNLVASNTENKIKDLVKKGTFDFKAAPKIMMISTFHFRGTLDMEMKPKSQLQAETSGNKQPKEKPKNKLQSTGGRQRRSQDTKVLQPFIETQQTPIKYGHFSNLGCSVVEIPFNNRLVTLVIVMPDHKNSTELLLTKLSAQVLSDLVNSLVVKRLSLGIPVIKFDRGPLNMNGLLKELGLDDLFFGDKVYSTETGLNRWMRPSDIIHETSIDIGTINPDWGQPEDRLKIGAHDSRTSDSNHIRLDKPFFYFVMDSINSIILTMGRIRQ